MLLWRRFSLQSASRRSRGIAPGDKLRHQKSLARFAETQRSAPPVRDLAAGGGDQGVTRRNVPFAGRGKTGIDVGAALRDPAELDRGAERPAHRAGPAVDEGVRAAVAVRTADGGNPLAAAAGKRSGRDRLRAADAAVRRDRETLGAVADKASPDRAERRRTDDSESGTPSVTIARLTVNSSRPAMNSLVPSSGSIRKKLPA